MSENEKHHPLLNRLRWFSTHARFPQSRLPSQAELLVLIAAAAEVDEAAELAASAAKGPHQRRDQAKDAAMRAHAMRRSLVHFRCDNSAKV